MTTTRIGLVTVVLAFALAGCGKKKDDGKADEPAAAPPTAQAEPAAAEQPPAEPAEPTPERKPIADGPVTLFDTGAEAAPAIATWKRGDVDIELIAEKSGAAEDGSTVAARVSARIGDATTELHVCDALYTATGGRAFVRLDAAEALYVVCNTRAESKDPDWFKGVRFEWNAEARSLDKAGEFESEQEFDPDTMEFGE